MNAVIEICRNYEIERNICIESTNKDFLKLFKTTQHNYKLFFYPDDFESGLATVKEMHLFGITISNKSITAEQIKTAHDNNVRVAVWDVASESDNIDAINKNPDFIQTDNVEGLIKLLK